MSVTEYLLDNRAAVAGARFAALSALFDDNTRRHVDALGIGPGARCWEVGAGGPTMPQLLAQRVGPGGHVLATDLDVSWIDQVPPSSTFAVTTSRRTSCRRAASTSCTPGSS